MKKISIILILLLSLMMSGCSDKNKNQYDIVKETYTDKNIIINYPQISNLRNREKQERLNEIIKTQALVVLEDYKNDIGN